MQLKIKYFLLGLITLVINPSFLFSSHLAGGKITYRYLGNNKYEYKLTVYRDCSDQVDFINPAIIHIYNKTNNSLVISKNIFLTNRSIVPVITPNPCFVPPAGLCLEVGNYIDTVQLSPNSAGYTISHQNCCHNASINNIVIPSSTPILITTDIPPQINNSAQFINVPPIFICVNDTFNYSFAATDSDGDVLKYNLCTPFKDGSTNYVNPYTPTPPPYNPILWSSSFSATNPIPNTGGILFNQNTGQLKFKPTQIGQYVIGICVEEYRNNTLINTNRLELQFNVVSCYLTSSIPTASNLCEGLTIPFQNSSTNANAFHWDFGVTSSTADTSNLFTPTFTFPNYGTYTVSLVVYNTAYGFCKDTSKKVINVNPLLSPTLQPSYSSCFKNNNLNFNVGGSFHPSANFNWNFTPNSISTSSTSNNTNVHFTTASTKTISVIINQFGCLDTLYSLVSFTNPIAAINYSTINCVGLTPFIGSTSTNANNVFFNFGDPTTTADTTSQLSQSYTYPSFGTYTITLIATNGICADTLKYPANIQPNLFLFVPNQIQKQCLKNNSFNFQASGSWGSNAVFNWTFPDIPNNITSNVPNPNNISFNSVGTHIFTVTLSQNNCIRVETRTVAVNPSPKAIALISDTIGCEPLTIKFKSITDSLQPVQNYWNINNNSFIDTTINYTFSNAGLYSYNLVVRDSNNCTDTLSKINHIQVNPKPKVKSIVNPFYASILDPRITFIDSTQLTHLTNYNFGDGATSTQTNNIHNYQSTGEFNYTLISSTQYGCADTAKGIIYIDDIGNNYVPNIFTPNGDNSNDNFFIKGKNITSSTMKIFNRWGTLVFETDNALIGWNGINQTNNTIAVDGVYFYIIEITLGNNRTYKFNGNVTLVK
ncbi:MAG: PKD domain-containing protein [Bacteroidota bacterium]|nr:gliding motility-associated C-terminal domain-containing protein [Bacteroidota bacterium]MCA6444164.1 gliding motility-associated C-terminal domain-containing protein [Bacteroidota bacterium]